ncbi:helical backbone metal receptor [Patiriisocius sp. Uisw_017]|jgi:ABC-type Fe3+-hydroxamate transport system substrate-binding protein|uniref:helical backbone metal receptor n=1 Tax=Patiriisocius sp. Uisw_017 TaxID=3230968 RepID=UPI0039EBE585
MHISDQLQRKLTFSKTPQRIISLVPSQTELLVSLGLEKSIVGVTKFCVHPVDIRKNTKVVGGTKNINFDRVRLLSPDIIICNKEENTKDIVETAATIAKVWVSDIYTINDVLRMITSLGEIFDVVESADNLISKIQTAKKDFQLYMCNKPNRNVAYLIWKNPYMAAGKNTFINHMLQLNKFENSVNLEDIRYPEVDFSSIKSVETVLLSSEPYPFKNSDCEEIKNALDVEVRLVDGEYFSWYGSRLIRAFEYFKSLH